MNCHSSLQEQAILSFTITIIAAVFALKNLNEHWTKSKSKVSFFRSVLVLIQVFNFSVFTWHKSNYAVEAKVANYLILFTYLLLLLLLLQHLSESTKLSNISLSQKIRLFTSFLPVGFLFSNFYFEAPNSPGVVNKAFILLSVICIFIEMSAGLYSKIMNGGKSNSDQFSYLIIAVNFSIILFICAGPTEKYSILSLISIFSSICLDFATALRHHTHHENLLSLCYYMFLIFFIRFSYFSSGHSIKFTDVPVSLLLL